MNGKLKEELKLIKNLKPTLLIPVPITLSCIVLIITFALNLPEEDSNKMLIGFCALAFLILSIGSWWIYISGYKNYQDAREKVFQEFAQVRKVK